jgi:hypothetical protein
MKVVQRVRVLADLFKELGFSHGWFKELRFSQDWFKELRL